MGKLTPEMNYQQLKAYLKDHLDYELQWLLRAATEWHVQKELKLEIDGYQVQIYAMDSSFLHARNLFDFFSKPTGKNSYGYDAYKVAKIKSELYPGDWAGPLHSHVMHPQNRSRSKQLTSFDGSSKKDLNEMPVDFAKETVRLWGELDKLLGNHSDKQINALQQVAEKILKDAISNAERVVSAKMIKDGVIIERSEMAKRYNIKPIAW